MEIGGSKNMNDEEIKKEFEEIKRRLDTLERKNKIDITSDNSSKKKSIKEFFIEKNQDAIRLYNEYLSEKKRICAIFPATC